MQIYMKDGKALRIGSQFIKPASEETKETWVLDSTAEYLGDESKVTFNADFASNGLSFSSITLSINLQRQIKYDNTVVKAFGSFTSEAYRKLIFDIPPTGDLLTWLQANGTKQ